MMRSELVLAVALVAVLVSAMERPWPTRKTVAPATVALEIVPNIGDDPGDPPSSPEPSVASIECGPHRVEVDLRKGEFSARSRIRFRGGSH